MSGKYADSLSGFGSPYYLRHSKGWLLKRRIPGHSGEDAISPYPIFCCREWSKLPLDIDESRAHLVTLSMVTDPFGDYSYTGLKECFEDVVVPFKDHYIVDLSEEPEDFISGHHMRNAKSAGKELHIEVCENPDDLLNDWVNLYDNLIKRHKLRGIHAFSALSFERQMRVPGIVMFRASHKGITVGILLWYVQGGNAYYHLGAHSDKGYELGASFGLFLFSLKYFKDSGLTYLSLGAGAGVKETANDGLARFKRGWSTGKKTAYFCGHIFNRDKYRELLGINKISRSDYFPAYRKGEFI